MKHMQVMTNTQVPYDSQWVEMYCAREIESIQARDLSIY